MLTCYISSCDSLHKDGLVSVLFPLAHAVEMIGSLADNFKMKFSDLHSRATDLSIFETTWTELYYNSVCVVVLTRKL
jgi:hypothetical protein